MKTIETLEEGKDFLKENWEKGTTCPCCTQNVKLYKVKLKASMVLVLIDFYKMRDKNWIHPIKELRTINGDYAKLRHWGFLEKNTDNSNPNTKASGLWRITKQGEAFIEGTFWVAEKVRLFNNKFYGFEGKGVGIKETLGNKFNYKELMNS